MLACARTLDISPHLHFNRPTSLIHVSESHSLVALLGELLGRHAVVLPRREAPLPLAVDGPIRHEQDQRRGDAQRDEAELEPVTQEVSRAVGLTVKV